MQDQAPDNPTEPRPRQRVVAVVVLVTSAALLGAAYYLTHFQEDAKSGALVLTAFVAFLAFSQAWRWLFLSTNLKGFLDTAFMFLLAPATYSLYWLEADGLAPFEYAATRLALPITALVLLATAAFRAQLFPPNRPAWRVYGGALVVSALLTLLAGPYVALANAVLPPQRQAVLEGTLLRKGTGTRNVLVFQEDANPHRTHGMTVSRTTFDRLQPGDTVQFRAIRGSLGLYYWRRW